MINKSYLFKKCLKQFSILSKRFFCESKIGSQNIKTQQKQKKLFDASTLSQMPTLKQFINENLQKASSNNQNQKRQIPSQSPLNNSYESEHNTYQNQQEQPIHTVFAPLKYHIETYGCQMNVNDSEIVRSILKKSSHIFQPEETQTAEQANVVFLNTCAIRQSAEHKIHTRIKQLKNVKNIKILGLLGCMAERLKDKMFTQGVNIICGPDAYRDLPKLIQTSLDKNFKSNQMNIQLSVEQTYADITPVRKNQSTISAFLSIMRGCNNMCSFCIVPFVRGRQRSRDVETILKEIQQLQSEGVKQITFLGQNVNSYHDISKSDASSNHQNSQGFNEMFKLRNNPGIRFAQLLEISAKSFPDLRFRFTSPHPKDFPDQVLEKIATYPNLCKYIHLPVQSGNTEMLFKMRRNHTREAYINLVKKMKQMIPTLTLSTDLICGFCGQTQQQFEDTLSLLKQIQYQNAFLFAYSMRQKTHAHRNYVDDVPLQVKKERLKKMIDVFTEVQRPLNKKQINSNQLLLIQNTSKKDQNKWIGKTDNFKKGIVPKTKIPYFKNGEFSGFQQAKLGDYVAVKVQTVGPRSLNCKPIAIVQKLSDYTNYKSKIINFNSLSSPQML